MRKKVWEQFRREKSKCWTKTDSRASGMELGSEACSGDRTGGQASWGLAQEAHGAAMN